MERLSEISNPEKKRFLGKRRSVDNLRNPKEVSEATERKVLKRRASLENFSKKEKQNQEWYKKLDNYGNLSPETQSYAKEVTESRIRQLQEIHNKADKELTEEYNKAKKDSNLQPDQKKDLEQEVRQGREELKQHLEHEVTMLREQLNYNTSAYLPWLQEKMSSELTDKYKQNAIDKSLKAYGDVPMKLVEASTEYEKEAEGVKKLATKVQEAYTNLCNARAASSGASHEEITFDHFDKTLSEVRSNQTIQDQAKKAGEDARKHQTVSYPNNKIKEAMSAINAETDEGRREAQVKKLLEETIVKDHTIFRLTKSESSETHLDTDEYKQKRLNEITSQDKVREAIQKISTGAGGNNRDDFIKGNLEITIKEAYLYSLDKNAQEAVIHKEAANLFSERISASAATRQDALKAVIASQKPGRNSNITKIRAANKEVHETLNQIQHFSPEAMKARNDFRNMYKEDMGATKTSTTLEEALDMMKEFKSKDPEALGALPKEVEDHIKVGTETNLSHIQAISKASIDKLNTLGLREKGDSTNIDADAFNTLRKQISDRYDFKIDQARTADTHAHDNARKIYNTELERIENFRKNRQAFATSTASHSEETLLEQTDKALKNYNASTLKTTQTYEKLVAERDAALNEARQLYSKESVSHYVDEVREQVKNLHTQLNKRDKALIKMDDVINAGQRVAAIKTRYEKSQYGEALKLDDDILDQMEESEKFLAAEREAVANVSAKQDLVHIADNDYALAKEDWEIKLREWNQIEKKKYEGPDQKGKDDLDNEKSVAKQLVEDARQVRDEAFKAKEAAKQGLEKAVRFKDEKTAEKHEADEKLHLLSKKREMAGKRDDANDAIQRSFLDRIREDMKAKMAFERQRILMRDHYRQQIKAAIIAGISQTLMDSFQRIGQSQYVGLNNMLIRG